jgi:hypothetical protein
MMKIIGITGRAGSGKTHLATELAVMNRNVLVLSFAAELRMEIEAEMGVCCPGLWKKPTSPAIRFILQQYGTEFRRAESEDYWMEKGMERARKHVKAGKDIIFDDVRFPNEAIAIQRAGGLIVRVLTPTAIREGRLGKLPPNHDSETAMDNFAYDLNILGTPGGEHDRSLIKIMVEATIDEKYFMEAIHDSLT